SLATTSEIFPTRPGEIVRLNPGRVAMLVAGCLLLVAIAWIVIFVLVLRNVAPEGAVEGFGEPQRLSQSSDGAADERERDGRMGQGGSDGLATTADVMVRPQDRSPHRGYRWRRLSGAGERRDRGRDWRSSNN